MIFLDTIYYSRIGFLFTKFKFRSKGEKFYEINNIIRTDEKIFIIK